MRISGTLQKKVLQNKKITTTIYFPQVSLVEKGSNPVLSLAAGFRQNISELFIRSLSSLEFTSGDCIWNPKGYTNRSQVVKKLIAKGIIAEDIATTVSAQLATLPIILSNFGTFSLVSIVVNGLVLWTISPLMIFGGVAAIVGLFFHLIGKIILFLSLPLLSYVVFIINVLDQTTVKNLTKPGEKRFLN